MMSPWQVPALGLGCPQRGWNPAPVLWDTEGSFVRCASRVTEERLRVSGHTARVCFVPAMDTVRHVTLRQVSRWPLVAASPPSSSRWVGSARGLLCLHPTCHRLFPHPPSPRRCLWLQRQHSWSPLREVQRRLLWRFDRGHLLRLPALSVSWGLELCCCP